jgi:hypothetical protein
MGTKKKVSHNAARGGFRRPQARLVEREKIQNERI